MHIHYNTNQTTLPLEISSFLPQEHLVFTIEKVVNTLKDSHFHAFYHAFGRPSYHPKMLVSTLLFAYSQGIFSGQKIEKMMIENLAMKYLTGQLVEFAQVLEEELEKLNQDIEQTPVKGKDERKTQRRKLKKVLRKVKEDFSVRAEKYEKHQETFEGRNSFSKTDTDATFMRIKKII